MLIIVEGHKGFENKRYLNGMKSREGEDKVSSCM